LPSLVSVKTCWGKEWIRVRQGYGAAGCPLPHPHLCPHWRCASVSPSGREMGEEGSTMSGALARCGMYRSSFSHWEKVRMRVHVLAVLPTRETMSDRHS